MFNAHFANLAKSLGKGIADINRLS